MRDAQGTANYFAQTWNPAEDAELDRREIASGRAETVTVGETTQVHSGAATLRGPREIVQALEAKYGPGWTLADAYREMAKEMVLGNGFGPRLSEEQWQALLEQERTLVADGVKAIKDVLGGRDWLTEGRGPYEWNDDKWHEEFAAAAKEIQQAIEPLERIARDLTNCPATWEQVEKARTFLTRPRLSDEQAKFLARMKRAREHGDMLSMHDCDILIQIIEETHK